MNELQAFPEVSGNVLAEKISESNLSPNKSRFEKATQENTTAQEPATTIKILNNGDDINENVISRILSSSPERLFSSDPETRSFKSILENETNFKELIDTKEKELRDIQQLRILKLELALQQKDAEVLKGKQEFDQLRTDFTYNLRLFADRDEEITQLERVIQRLEVEAVSMKKSLESFKSRADTDASTIENLRANLESSQVRMRSVERDLQKEKEDAIRKVAEMSEIANKKAQEEANERRIAEETHERERQSELEKQREEVKQTFNILLREQEQKYQIQVTQLSQQVSDATAEIQSLRGQLEELSLQELELKTNLKTEQEKCLSLENEVKQCKESAHVAVHDCNLAKERVIQEQEKVRRLKEKIIAEYEEKMAEVNSSLHVVEEAFTQMRNEHEAQLQQLVIEQNERNHVELDLVTKDLEEARQSEEKLALEVIELKQKLATYPSMKENVQKDFNLDMENLNMELNTLRSVSSRQEKQIQLLESALGSQREESAVEHSNLQDQLQKLRVDRLETEEKLNSSILECTKLKKELREQNQVKKAQKHVGVQYSTTQKVSVDKVVQTVENVDRRETHADTAEFLSKNTPDAEENMLVESPSNLPPKADFQNDTLFEGDFGAVSPVDEFSESEIKSMQETSTQNEIGVQLETLRDENAKLMREARVAAGRIRELEDENSKLLSSLHGLRVEMQSLENNLTEEDANTTNPPAENKLMLSHLMALRSEVAEVISSQGDKDKVAILPDDRLSDALAELGRTSARLRRVTQERDKLTELSNSLHSKLRKAERMISQATPSGNAKISTKNARMFQTKVETIEKALGQLADQNQMLKGRIRFLEGKDNKKATTQNTSIHAENDEKNDINMDDGYFQANSLQGEGLMGQQMLASNQQKVAEKDSLLRDANLDFQMDSSLYQLTNETEYVPDATDRNNNEKKGVNPPQEDNSATVQFFQNASYRLMGAPVQQPNRHTTSGDTFENNNLQNPVAPPRIPGKRSKDHTGSSKQDPKEKEPVLKSSPPFRIAKKFSEIVATGKGVKIQKVSSRNHRTDVSSYGRVKPAGDAPTGAVTTIGSRRIRNYNLKDDE